ncbi:MAG: DUF760 domain-containing protein [Candidatus Sericytochromatia bacterium]|nr:DUF760 domain-containing protein [Candidatus Sericytochromatia bacterium]
MRFFRIPFQSDDDDAATAQRRQRLNRYIQSQSAEDMARLAAEISPEIKQLVAANVQALLGHLPPQDFHTSISTSKENLQNLLASAMLTGYFMHAMEQRLAMETLLGAESDTAAADKDTAETAERTSEAATSSASDAPDLPHTAEPDLPDSGLVFEADAAAEDAAETMAPDFGGPGAELLRDPRDLFGHPDKLDIQLEINTRMDHAELVKLLKALKRFQQADDDEPDLLDPFSER